jgi:ribosomal protein S27AE
VRECPRTCCNEKSAQAQHAERLENQGVKGKRVGVDLVAMEESSCPRYGQAQKADTTQSKSVAGSGPICRS